MIRRFIAAAAVAALAMAPAYAQLTYTKPSVRDAWADQAAAGDIADPGNAFVSAGWLSSTTPPARQYFNWAFNYPSAGIRYFEQRGIVDWDTAELYQSGAIVIGPDGLVYRSLVNTNKGHTPASSPTFWGSPVFAAPPSVGWTNNMVATAGWVQSAISGLAPLFSPVFIGDPRSVTPITGDSSTAIATTAYVQTTVSAYAPLASPALSGVPTAPTAPSATNTTQLATTAYVKNNLPNLTAYAPLASPQFTGVPTAPTAAANTSSTQLATTAFSNPGSLIAQNGYTKLPSGLIMQWGLAVTHSDNTTVAFPIVFPHACFHVSGAQIIGSNPPGFNLAANCGTSSFIFTDGGFPAYWIAIGW